MSNEDELMKLLRLALEPHSQRVQVLFEKADGLARKQNVTQNIAMLIVLADTVAMLQRRVMDLEREVLDLKQAHPREEDQYE